jgi:hypothetical protein
VVCADQPKVAWQPSKKVNVLLLVRLNGDGDAGRFHNAGTSQIDGFEEID